MATISEQVAQIHAGQNDRLVCRVASGWVVMGEAQFLPGYCLLLPDPVVGSLNDLTGDARRDYLLDMARVGDAVLSVTGARRINYEMLGNVVPELHAHVFPRYADEPADLATRPVWSYDWDSARKFRREEDGELQQALCRAIESLSC